VPAHSARKQTRPTAAKSAIKTTKNAGNVEQFLNGVKDETRRRDALAVLKMMKTVTGKPPRMWGSHIVGFDEYHYKYASGREGTMCVIGFSPRANDVTLYLTMDFKPFAPLLKKLGKHKTGVSCLHIKNLKDVDEAVLEEVVTKAYRSRRRD